MRPLPTLLGFGACLLVLSRALTARPVRPSPRTDWPELVRSTTAMKLGLDNTPPLDVYPALWHVGTSILEPLRAVLGNRIRVTSGYRSLAVNQAVGGAANSAHLRGEALDLAADGLTPRELASLILELGVAYDALVVYEGVDAHVHVEARACCPQRPTGVVRHGAFEVERGIRGDYG